MDKQELSRMYLDEHLTMEQIGKLVGMTRAGVQYWVRKHEVDVSKAEKLSVVCDGCYRERFEITRKRFTKSAKHFHNMGCYKKYLQSPEYRNARDQQRIARVTQEERNSRLRI